MTLVDLRMEEKNLPLGHIENQKTTIVTHQSMCALPPEG
jgi:hypothetical protein